MIIKIFGSDAEGKTTVAQLIAKTLKSHGIDVENTDTDDPAVSLDQRLKKIGNDREPLQCTIKTIKLKSETRPQYAKDFRP